jgi:hypothetical protein
MMRKRVGGFWEPLPEGSRMQVNRAVFRYVEAINNRGVSLQDLKAFDEALARRKTSHSRSNG